MHNHLHHNNLIQHPLPEKQLQKKKGVGKSNLQEMSYTCAQVKSVWWASSELDFPLPVVGSSE